MLNSVIVEYYFKLAHLITERIHLWTNDKVPIRSIIHWILHQLPSKKSFNYEIVIIFLIASDIFLSPHSKCYWYVYIPVLNLISFSIIALGYLWMYVVARTTQQAVQKEQRPSDNAMARRMTLIVATDAACWMPIILLGVLSLGGITVPPQVKIVLLLFTLLFIVTFTFNNHIFL